MGYAFAIFVAVVLYVLLAKFLSSKPAIRLMLHTSPQGTADLMMLPSEPPLEQLTVMTLMYGAKLRWLLNNEPDVIRGVFALLVVGAGEFWTDPNVVTLARGSEMADIMRTKMAEGGAPFSVPGGEKFEVRYLPQPSGEGRITNDIPRPGVAQNLAWHYVHVLDALRARQSPAERAAFAPMLNQFGEFATSPKADAKGMAALMQSLTAADVAARTALGTPQHFRPV